MAVAAAVVDVVIVVVVVLITIADVHNQFLHVFFHLNYSLCQNVLAQSRYNL